MCVVVLRLSGANRSPLETGHSHLGRWRSPLSVDRCQESEEKGAIWSQRAEGSRPRELSRLQGEMSTPLAGGSEGKVPRLGQPHGAWGGTGSRGSETAVIPWLDERISHPSTMIARSARWDGQLISKGSPDIRRPNFVERSCDT